MHQRTRARLTRPLSRSLALSGAIPLCFALAGGCQRSAGSGDAHHDSGGEDGDTGGTAGAPMGGGGASGGAGGGSSGSGGSPQGGSTGGQGTGDASSSGGPLDAAGDDDAGPLPRFSFFVTSVAVMRKLSGSQNGFGGDLRFGQKDGLSGADEICRQAAELGMKGAGRKVWRAFLSATVGGPGGGPVNAIDRVGNGPWYDRLGRLFAMTKDDLAQTRPRNADNAIVNDFPNEDGVPNHAPDPGQGQVDNHDMLTGSKTDGTLYSADPNVTCNDWTSAALSGSPRCGHSWPRGNQSWISVVNEAGCGAGVNLVESGGPNPRNKTVGSGGGYGGFYCFSTTP